MHGPVGACLDTEGTGSSRSGILEASRNAEPGRPPSVAARLQYTGPISARGDPVEFDGPGETIQDIMDRFELPVDPTKRQARALGQENCGIIAH